MRQIDADKLERETTLAYIETCRGLTLEQIDAVARFSAKVISIIGHTPTADADPTKHGRWEKIVHPWYECSECGERTAVVNLNGEVVWNYCPNCGSKMDAQIGEDKSHPFAESVMMGMDEVEE